MASPSEEELRARIADGSREPDDYEDLARALVATGRFEESLGVLRRALELDLAGRDRARISVSLGWWMYESGPPGLEEALLRAREAAALLEGEATTAEVLALRGMVQCLLGHCLWWSDERSARDAARLAVTALEEAIRETPDAEWADWARYDTARAYTILSEGQKAIPHLQGFLEGDRLDQERVSGLSVLAEAFRLAGRLEEAGHAVEEGLELARGNANALPLLYQTRAFIRRDAGRSEEATRDFELTREALAEHRCRDDPEWLKSIHGNLGQLYYDAGDYSRAAAAYRQLLRWYPEADASQAAVLNVLGQCHNGLGEYAEARHYFEAVLAAPSVSGESRVAAERDPLSASAHQARVSGDHEQAAALFGRMLDHHPDDVTERHHVLLWLGHSLYAAQRYEEALLRYEEVASSPRAEPDDRAQAEEWARWSTGRIRHAAGELAEAAETFGRLVDTYPEDHSQRCNALLWLAACYRYLGAAAGARERYEAILTAPTATGSERTSARQGLAEADQSG